MVVRRKLKGKEDGKDPVILSSLGPQQTINVGLHYFD